VHGLQKAGQKRRKQGSQGTESNEGLCGLAFGRLAPCIGAILARHARIDLMQGTRSRDFVARKTDIEEIDKAKMSRWSKFKANRIRD